MSLDRHFNYAALVQMMTAPFKGQVIVLNHEGCRILGLSTQAAQHLINGAAIPEDFLIVNSLAKSKAPLQTLQTTERLIRA